jgi:alanine racemase
MDMLAVDLSNAPEAVEGDPVELWGRTVGVDEVASCAGTISYELLTGVTSRVPRTYI